MAQLRPLAVAVLTLGLGASLAASGPTFWTIATSLDFLKGTSDGVYVSLSGTVTAGPALTNRLTSTPAQVWSLAQGSDGTIWAGTGGDGRLLRLRNGQPEETVFTAPEANIFAIAVAGNRVFAATSPDGKVYVIEGNAPARVFFDPQEKYIWALAVDGAGRLWVGAGNPAVLYRVLPDGTSTALYKPPAAHVVALTLDANGRMLAGTESPGRLYRFDAADKPFVLLDSGLAELRAAAVDANGVVFAAAVAKGEEPATGGESASVAATLAAAPATTTGGTAATPAAARRGVLYRIATDNTWEEIWNTPDVIYDLATQADGGVLVASGPEGRLYKVDRNLDVALLTGVDARQITRFAPGVRGSALTAFATAAPGRVVTLGAGDQPTARYVSSVRDSRSVATWGLLRWDATGPVALATRSGNTERPDDSWSEWSPAYTRADGEPITSPVARYLQWRATFTRPASGPASTLTSVTVAYLARNTRPAVSSITVHPPGVVFQRPYVNDESAIAGLDESAAESRRPPGDPGPPTPAPGKRMLQKGLQTLAWKADDEDDDHLTFTVQYRREGETAWHDLKSGLTDSIFVWDTTTVADGRYVARVLASDAASNAAARALVGDRESDPINVDNTPPVITTEITRQGSSTHLLVRVRDARNPIQKVEYSKDGGAWQLVYPVDGLADSADERYDIVVASDREASQIVIRATDLLLNVVSQPVGR
ncbi:MAG: hypothetical protein ABI634_06120 [Acidobacteriota bacterium]